jgi:cytochrome bd-type quinol oxidase subunit 2
MATESKYTTQSYNLSKLILCLLTIAALAVIINTNPTISRYLFGLPVVLSGLLGIVGSVILYKGRNEPNDEKKVIAFIVNLAMVLLIVAIFISNTLY